MPKLSAKNGAWDLPHVHEWKDRQRDLRVTPTPLVDEGTRVEPGAVVLTLETVEPR